MHLREVPEPSVSDIPDGRGVLVKVLRVGVDGTDKEINAAEYGDAPEGDDFLITGHESLGRVVEVGADVPGTHPPRHARRRDGPPPGHRAIYDRIGLQDMTTDDVYFERGINRRHGYLAEYYVEDAEYVVPLPRVPERGRRPARAADGRREGDQPGLRDPAPAEGVAAAAGRRAGRGHGRPARRAGAAPARHRGHLSLAARAALPEQRPDRGAGRAATCRTSRRRSPRRREQHGPFDLIVEATGFSPLVFEAAEALGKNGVLVLVSVTGGDRTAEVHADPSTRASCSATR